MNSKLILVINCGSSSLKFALYSVRLKDKYSELLAEGLADSLNTEAAKLHIKLLKQRSKITHDTQTHAHAIQLTINELENVFGLKTHLTGIGHRVVHGGDRFKRSVIIDEHVIAEIKNCVPLAPLHNPANLLGIEILQQQFPALAQVAVFDTSFHQTMPPTAYIYAIPYHLYETEGVRRYGFHGSSHRYVMLQAVEKLKIPVESINLITAHLGNGCSVAAIANGKSVDTSMGMTPLEGLVMGTRSGDIDPGIFDFLITKGVSPEKINQLLNKESGLQGISGESNDMRTLCEKAEQGHERCQLAIDIFCFRLAKYISAMMVSLKELDALVFTGGIGENSSVIRENTIAHLAIMGFELDKVANETITHDAITLLSSKNSKKIMIIPTDEEIMIVNDTLELIPGID